MYETSNATLSQEPPSLASIAPGVPPQLDWIVHRMLAKDPAERFASSDEVCAALKELRLQLASELLTASGPRPALAHEIVSDSRKGMSKVSRRMPSIAVLAFENLSGEVEQRVLQRRAVRGPHQRPRTHPRRQGGLENVGVFLQGEGEGHSRDCVHARRRDRARRQRSQVGQSHSRHGPADQRRRRVPHLVGVLRPDTSRMSSRCRTRSREPLPKPWRSSSWAPGIGPCCRGTRRT